MKSNHFVNDPNIHTNKNQINQHKQDQKFISPNSFTILNKTKSNYKIYYKNKLKIINGYKIYKSVLGEGSHGKIFKAFDIKNNKPVAIKEISLIKLKKIKNGINNIKNEIFIMKKLNHENVIKFYDFFEQNDFLYIVIELVTGGSLQNKLENSAGKLNHFQAKKFKFIFR